MGLLAILTRTIGLWWRSWPWLIAIYLVGWLARYWALQAAIAVGLAHGPVWGAMVVAFAPMIRLMTYLAMFLVIRSATAGLQHVEPDGQEPRGAIDIALTAVLPFLVIYTAWKLLTEDYYVYYTTIGYTSIYQGLQNQVAEYTGPVGATVWIVVAVALAVRQTLIRFRDRLPRWTMVVAVYAEVLWIFLVLQAGLRAMIGTPEWISQRRVVVWLADIRDDVFSHFAVLAHLWDAIGAVVGSLLPAAGLALAWLAIAGVVYGTPLPPTWAGARRIMLGRKGDAYATRAVQRGRTVVQSRWDRLPGEIRSRGGEFARSRLGRFESVVDSARLILHGGAIRIAFYILLYAVTVVLAPSGAYFDRTVTDGHLFRGIALLLGPHEWSWWESFSDVIRLAIDAMIDPLRICLVAATYWFCVDAVRAEHAPAHSR